MMPNAWHHRAAERLWRMIKKLAPAAPVHAFVRPASLYFVNPSTTIPFLLFLSVSLTLLLSFISILYPNGSFIVFCFL
jgi:hypothetical protein